MPLIGFQERWAPKILSGEKQQTIRLKRKRPIKPGDKLYFYTGLRTKKAKKIGEAVCTYRANLLRECRGSWATMYFFCRDNFTEYGLLMFAKKDGFDSVEEFEDWFDRYGDNVELDLILWMDFTPAQAQVFKPLPPGVVRSNNGQQCDVADGPCACGAWHKENEK